ncbi:MAG: class II aldolase/adducin family protein, partial [Sulfurovaceae bacterium]|nr:class II aldolase/adducin family protein [Sulfurovaceae bacterium]
MDKHLINEIKHISHSMFQKNYFGVFHGSISARTSIHSFIINKKETILDEVKESCFIELNCLKSKDYRWNEASVDVDIHEKIYKALANAKYISYTMPPYATAYSLHNKKLIPQDYYGHQLLENITIYDPEDCNNWNQRAGDEITTFFKNSNERLLLIKGF